MLNLIISRAGAGKTFEIHKKIKEYIKSDISGVTLIIPEQVSFETEREMLHLLGAKDAQKVEVMSFTALCTRFFEQFGGRTKPYIDAVGKTVLMKTAVNSVEHELTLFKKSAKNTKFCEIMLDFSSTLKKYSVTPQQLMTAAGEKSGSFKEKLLETSVILSAYESLLSQDYIDPLDNLTIVGERLENHAFFAGKTVFIDAFVGFTEQQLKIIAHIIKTAEETHIALGFDGVYRKTDFCTFANMAKTAKSLKEIAKSDGVKILPDKLLIDGHRFKNDELLHLERNIFAPDFQIFAEKTQKIAIFEAKNIYDEADFVARTVRNLVRAKNLRYREIAVISRDASMYNEVMSEAFARYDVPCFIDDALGAGNLALFRLVFFALESVINGFESENITGLLKTGLFGFSDDDVSLFEVYINFWRIERKGFEKEFEFSPREVFSTKDEGEETEILSKINSVRSAVITPLLKLKSRAGKSAKSICTALFELLREIDVAKGLKALSECLQGEGFIRLSETTTRSYDILIGVLDQLYLALGGAEVNRKQFYELFSSAVNQLDIGSLPQGLDEVAVGSAERMRPKSPKVTFVVGANEGVFPSAKQGSGIFSDNELEVLKNDGLALPFFDIDTAVDEQYLAYCALCSASERLFVSYSKGDLSGEELKPSVIVLELKKLFSQLCVCEQSAPLIENADTALLVMTRERSVLSKSIEEYFKTSEDEKYKALKSVSHKALPALSPDAARRLYGENIRSSASKMDVFYKCRFYYFCKYGIKAAPEKSAEIDALKRGSLVHYILERSILSFSPEEFLCKSDGKKLEITAGFIEEFFEKEPSLATPDGLEKHRLGELNKMAADLVTHAFYELQSTEFVFYKSEFEIGGKSADVPAFKVEFGSGKVTISGSVDRVDTYRSGGRTFVRIIDYKTGVKTFTLTDIGLGQNLQMLIYMIALKKNGEKFFPNLVPSAILYFPAREVFLPVEDRDLSEAEAGGERAKKAKMNGLLLDDYESYTALEPSGEGFYTPVKVKKDGTLNKRSAAAYTYEQFELLTQHVQRLTKRMGKSLHSGEIAANPVDGSSAACKYCDYKSVCFFEGKPEKSELKSGEFYEFLEKRGGFE